MARELLRPVDTDKAVVSFVSRVGDSMQRALRLVAIAGLSITLAACGGGGGDDSGGGGGGGGGGGPPPTGSITGTVTDRFGTLIENATVTATIAGQTFTRMTASNGVATLPGIPTGTVGVVVTANGFKASATQNLVVTANNTTSFSPNPIVLERSTQAAGGFVLSRVVGTPSVDGQTISFRLQLIVVNEASQAVTTLTAADMTLQPCVVVVSATPDEPECLRAVPMNDVGYTVPSSTPDSFALIPANAAQPYAAAMLLDQSGSIRVSDPTDARIFASKVFMGGVGTNDRVVLSAFAVDGGEGPARIPTQPLTIYASFTSDGSSFFDELNQLSNLEGGSTPLYQSLDSMIDYTRDNAPATGIPGQLKAVVLFSDGKDTVCSAANQLICRADAIKNAVDSGVDIFTIGLSDEVDFEAMAELADRASGAFLFAENAEQLIPIYGALGNLLSDSLAKYDVTWTIQAAAPNTFVSGRTILGNVQVRTSSNPVNLPIIVRIP